MGVSLNLVSGVAEKYTMNWKMTLSRRLELECGDIDYNFGGLIPPTPTSVEQCHNFFHNWD